MSRKEEALTTVEKGVSWGGFRIAITHSIASVCRAVVCQLFDTEGGASVCGQVSWVLSAKTTISSSTLSECRTSTPRFILRRQRTHLSQIVQVYIYKLTWTDGHNSVVSQIQNYIFGP